MKNKGCAFEITGGGSSRYYISPAVRGFADFARFLHANRANTKGVPLPMQKRIPQAEQISAADWQDIADGKADGFSCYFIINIPENLLWVNEDRGAGLALYAFPFKAVLEAAACSDMDIWELLLSRFPDARKA